MPAAPATPGVLPFAIEFGQPFTTEIPRERGLGLALHVPLLGGASCETFFSGTGDLSMSGELNVLTAGDSLIGWTTKKIAEDRGLIVQTHNLYRQVLKASKGRHLHRIWNYVPRINAVSDGLENYQAFCQGRSFAFEEALCESFPHALPSASAVGTEDGYLSLVFIASATAPRYVENPDQIPAYRYPLEHGPRSPSFSRATVGRVAGRNFTFISGTSAIKGHTTVAPGSLPEQLACTVENLRIVSREAGAGEELSAGQNGERHFKIYLRHARDFAAAKKYLEHELLGPTDRITYLQANICRAALNVEIEATLIT